MADDLIDLDLIYLLDNWPAPNVVNPNMGIPPDGFTGATHHNVVANAFPIGSKVAVYNTGVTLGNPGWSTFIYLQIGTQNPDIDIAVKTVCVGGDASHWYIITNDGATGYVALVTGAAVVALSAMTDAYYGWFWCAGVCPEEAVPTLTGDIATGTGMVAGPFTAHALEATYTPIGLGPAICATTAAAQPVWGYTLADDG